MPAAVIAANAQAIENAARLLRSGEIVAFPTETDYGLGAARQTSEPSRPFSPPKPGRTSTH